MALAGRPVIRLTTADHKQKKMHPQHDQKSTTRANNKNQKNKTTH